MRLGIAQQLSLLLAGAVALAVLTVGGLSAWTLGSGFSDYLRLRDEEQMTQLAELVQARAAANQGMSWLSQDRLAMRDLMDELHGRPPQRELDPPPQTAAKRAAHAPRPEGFARPPAQAPNEYAQPHPPRPDRYGPPPHPGEGPDEYAQRPPPWPDRYGPPPQPGDAPNEYAQGRPPRPAQPPPRLGQDRPPPPDGRANPGMLFDRVIITDAQGRWLAGRQPPGTPQSKRAVQLNGVDIAYLALVPEAPPVVGLDALFLQRQYTGLLVGGLLTVLAALLAAWWVARRWSRPLLALSQASRQIAAGERHIALQPAGAHEMAQLGEDMNHMAHSLARLEQARRLWIAQISHELRTPLAVLRGELEAIEDGARQATPAVLRSLRDEVMQLNRLVDDLHTLSVADMGALHCDFQTGDADALLRRVVARFEAPAQQRGLRLSWPTVPTPVQACWDFQRIEQLLNNLLTNSLRYTDAPGQLRVGWHTAADGKELTLTVEDSAPSVQPDDLDQLFEPLFRADKARQRGAEHGSGLGLAIVRRIATAHHGEVSAQQSALGGLLLTVQLPLQAQSAASNTKTPT